MGNSKSVAVQAPLRPELHFLRPLLLCLGCMYFRAPHAALKQKQNYLNKSYFQGPLNLMKRRLLATLSK